jgi:hypothetical protein
MERDSAPTSPKAGSAGRRSSTTPKTVVPSDAPDLEDMTFANIENSVLEMFDRQISTTGLSAAQRMAVNEGLKKAAKQVTESLQVNIAQPTRVQDLYRPFQPELLTE